MSAILALDTSTQACSVALIIDGVLLEDFRIAPRQHNDLILPMVDQILSQADMALPQLDAIAFGRGPGSFTGLRIAAGIAQGLAYGADLPVIPVSTLAAMALQGFEETGFANWLSALDARMGEIYLGGYQISRVNGKLEIACTLPERVLKPDVLEPLETQYQAVGSGWTYLEVLSSRLPGRPEKILQDVAPRAACIASIAEIEWLNGHSVSALHAIPTYLRDEVTWEKQPPRIGKRS